MKISFLIPAFNDEKTITRAIHEAAVVGTKLADFEIICVNDASTDETGKILRELEKKHQQLRLITHTKNLGYGRTIKELYSQGRLDWLFSVPGDYQVGARELLKLLPYAGKAEMIIGWRRDRHDPAYRLIQSWIYNHSLNLLFGLQLHDVNSVRLMRGSLVKKFSLTSDSAFVDAELAVKARVAGFRIVEVPIAHRKRLKRSRGGGGKLAIILPTIGEMLSFYLQRSRL